MAIPSAVKSLDATMGPPESSGRGGLRPFMIAFKKSLCF